MTTETLEVALAQLYVDQRLENFRKLPLQVKKLILGVMDYYLDTFYPFDSEAGTIVTEIRAMPTEEEMVDLCKRFFEFLPVRLRSGVQGRYLFQEPNEEEKVLNEKAVLDYSKVVDFDALLQELHVPESLHAELNKLAENTALNGTETLNALEGLVMSQLGDKVNPEEAKQIFDFLREEEKLTL